LLRTVTDSRSLLGFQIFLLGFLPFSFLLFFFRLWDANLDKCIIPLKMETNQDMLPFHDALVVLSANSMQSLVLNWEIEHVGFTKQGHFLSELP
jgi:hypothetical protein